MLAFSFYFDLDNLYRRLDILCDVNFDSLEVKEKTPDSLEAEIMSICDLDSLEKFSVPRDTPTDSFNADDPNSDSLECKSLQNLVINLKHDDINQNNVISTQHKNCQHIPSRGFKKDHVPTNVLEFLIFYGNDVFIILFYLKPEKHYLASL